MEKIAENTWKVGTCTLKKVIGVCSKKATWYCIDSQGGMAGFDTRKAALNACESRNEWAAWEAEQKK